MGPAVTVQPPEMVQLSQPAPQLKAVHLLQSLRAVPPQLSSSFGGSGAAPAPPGGVSQERLLRHFLSR